jgi:hypothetical protein
MISGAYFKRDDGNFRFKLRAAAIGKPIKSKEENPVTNRFKHLCNLGKTGRTRSQQKPRLAPPDTRGQSQGTNFFRSIISNKKARPITPQRYQRQPEPIVKVRQKSTFF